MHTPLLTIASGAGLRLAAANLWPVFYELRDSGDLVLTRTRGLAAALQPIQQYTFTDAGRTRAEILEKVLPLEQPLFGKPQRIFCNTCGAVTLHVLIGQPVKKVVHREKPNWTATLNQLCKCPTCGEITLRMIVLRREDDAGNYEQAFLPARHRRPRPDWTNEKGGEVPARLVGEIYQAYDAGSYSLVSMGLRSLVNLYCVERLGRDVGFAEGLDGMVTAGLMAENTRGHLATAVGLGHAVVHRGHEPTAEEIEKALKIVESWLQSLLTLPATAADLKASVPSDPRRRQQRGLEP
jgi:hypothetical protein